MDNKRYIKTSKVKTKFVIQSILYFFILLIINSIIGSLTKKYLGFNFDLGGILNWLLFIYLVIILIYPYKTMDVDFNSRKFIISDNTELNFDDVKILIFNKSFLLGFNLSVTDTFKNNKNLYAFSNYSNKHYDLFKREFGQRAKTDKSAFKHIMSKRINQSPPKPKETPKPQETPNNKKF